MPSLEQISDRLNAAAMCVQGPPASPWHASRRTSPCSSSRLSKRTCAALLKLTPACEDLEDGDEAPQEGVEVSPRNLRDRNLCKGRRPSEHSGVRGAHRLVSGPHRAAASVLLEDAKGVSRSAEPFSPLSLVLFGHQAAVLWVKHESPPKETLCHQSEDAKDQEEPLSTCFVTCMACLLSRPAQCHEVSHAHQRLHARAQKDLEQPRIASGVTNPRRQSDLRP